MIKIEKDSAYWYNKCDCNVMKLYQLNGSLPLHIYEFSAVAEKPYAELQYLTTHRSPLCNFFFR